MSSAKKTFPRTQLFALGIQLAGDIAFSFAGLSLAYLLRFGTPLRYLGVWGATFTFAEYAPLLVLGTAFLVGTYGFLGLYDGRLLLRPQRAMMVVLRAIVFWFAAFLCTSLAFKLEPAISRLFVLIACGTTFVSVGLWHWIFYSWLARSRFRQRLVQKILLVGWNQQAAELAEAVHNDNRQPYQIIGIVPTAPRDDVPRHLPVLGQLADLPGLLTRPHADILVVTDLDLSTDQLVAIANACERAYVDFKVIPSFFQTFVSNLRLQSISGVAILGVEDLPIQRLPNVILKRVVDIIGALAGLALSAPIIAVLAWLIKRESPGPIFFVQRRVGYHGQEFWMLKLRSMRADAHLQDHLNQSTLRVDPRVTRIGAFMRRTNLDELPQFWNVLCGEMSLVGPRPERSFHAEQLSLQIPHYNPRHSVRPGMTGWAQIHGFRGDTSLIGRVNMDLYYIENWSLWLDIQILVLTFFKRKNAY